MNHFQFSNDMDTLFEHIYQKLTAPDFGQNLGGELALYIQPFPTKQQSAIPQQVKHLMKLPDGAIRVLVEGLYRGQIVSAIEQEDDYLIANVREYHDKIDKSIEMEALVRVVVHEFEQKKKKSTSITETSKINIK